MILSKEVIRSDSFFVCFRIIRILCGERAIEGKNRTRKAFAVVPVRDMMVP